MKELSLGQEVRIRCVENKNGYPCTNCVFNIYGGNCEKVACASSEREDEKQVYFEIVKGEKEITREEAIAQVKEWLKEQLNYVPMDGFLAQFESDMNKLWEGKK